MTALMICQQTGATDKAIQAMNLDEKGAMGVQIGLAAAMLVVNIGACILSGGAAAGGVASGVANVAAAGAEAGAAGAEVGTTGAEAGAAAGEVAAASVEATTDASVAGAEASGTAAESAAGAGEETSTATDSIASTTQRSGRLVQVANRVRSAAMIAQAVPQAGGGSAQVATSDYRYQAATARADTQDEKAELAEAQEVTLEDLRRIRKLIEEMQNAATMVIGTIDESRETEMHIRRTI